MTCTCSPPPEEDNWSTASNDSLGSLDDLEPQTHDFSDGNFSKVNKDLLNILHYNVNSVQNKMDQIEARSKELNADIICLTETKLDDKVAESNYSLPGYNTEHRHRTSSGGGVLVLIKNTENEKHGTYGVIMEIENRSTATIRTRKGLMRRALCQLIPLAGSCLVRKRLAVEGVVSGQGSG